MDRVERPHWIISFLASRHCRWVLLIALAVALMPPKSGLGIELCMMKRLTDAPCPGCGMTRSGSNLVRGNFRQAFNFHPLGYVLHPILLGLVFFSVLPQAFRVAFAKRLVPWQRALRLGVLLFLIVFFAFGVVRWVAVVTGHMEFPAKWVDDEQSHPVTHG